MIRKCLTTLLLIGSLLPNTLLADTLLQPSSLSYLGAFRVPQGAVGDPSGNGFAYGGSVIAFNPANNSLFMVGYDPLQLVAEIGIPANPSTSAGSMPTASALQNFHDITGGQVSLSSQGNKIGGLAVVNNQLVGTVYNYYDGSNAATTSHFKAGTSLSSNSFQGMYMVNPSPLPLSGSNNAGFVSGYMAPVPDNSTSGGTNWQTALGAPYLVGNADLSIIGRTSFGPSAFSFNPANIANNTTASSLLYYDINHESLGAWSDTMATSPYVSIADNLPGMVFPAGTQSVIFTGLHGTGSNCYGEGGATDPGNHAGVAYCYDPALPYKGTHSYPYEIRAYAYDAAYLAKVKAGATIQSGDIANLTGNPVVGQVIKPWNLKPYAAWKLPLTTSQSVYTVFAGASTYDPTTQRLYVVQPGADNSPSYGLPLIHVFQVNTGTAATPPPTTPGPDTAAPSVPANLTAVAASASQVNVTWTAATDNTAVTGYNVFRNGTQIGTATTNSYQDSGLAANTAYSYTVAAYDAAGNTSAQSTSMSATTQQIATGGTGTGGSSINLACNVTPLPITGTRIVNVSTEAQLQTAVSNLQAGDTIVLADGTYNLTNSLYINGKNNVTIRGASGCDNVVLVGKGMDNASYGNVVYGVWSNSLNTTIAHLTIRDTYDNAIVFNAGAQSPLVYSTKLLNSGSQFIKANPTDAANGVGVNNGTVEYSWMEYTSGNGPTSDHGSGVGYFNGMSLHSVNGWDIKNNMFKNLHNPDSSTTWWWNPSVLIWDHSQNCVVEQNVFINSDRAVAFGLQDATGSDNTGGTIRNNFVYLQPSLFSATRKANSDAQIVIWDSPASLVDQNTVLTNGNVARSIEFRFVTTGAEAKNNLADAPIGARDSATYAQSGNYLSATSSMFVAPTSGDLHLVQNTSTTANVIGKAATLTSVPSDLDGDIRPAGGNTDIGADQLLSVSDTSAPSVNITSPVSASTVSGTVSVVTSASDNVGVSKVELYVNNVLQATDTAAPYTFTWNTTGVANGSYTLTSKAYDAAGNVGASAAVAVTVNNTVADTTAPTTSISSPVNGSTLSGTVSVSTNAADNVGVSKVELYVNNILQATDTAAPYSFTWNTAAVANGSYTLTSKAYDAAGNVGASAAVTVTVNNAVADTTAPTTSISSPVNGSTLSGTVSVATNASDNVGVSKVEFYVNNALQATDTTAPYTFTWNTAAVANGSYTLTSKAYDAAGNVGVSAAVTVTVNNQVVVPPTQALAIDATVYTDSSASGSSIKSPTVTTKVANELLVAFIAASSPGSGSNTTVTKVTNTGTALTWTKAVRTNGQRGTAEIWWAYAPAAMSGTVTATMSQSSAARSITVMSFTGTASGSAAIGATGSGSAASGAPTASLVTTRANSWVFGVGNDWTNQISRTVGSGQTMAHQFLSPTNDTYWVQRQTASTPAAGTKVTINDLAPTSDMYNLSIVEIRTP
jgi:hypothetical protein